MGIIDRLNILGRAGDLLKLLEYVDLTELPEATGAILRVRTLAASLDVADSAEVGALIDASVEAIRQTVDITKTQADDAVVEVLAGVALGNRDFLVTAIQWLAKRPDASEGEFTAAMSREAHAGAIPLGIWIEIAMAIWTFVKPWLNRGS